MGQAWCKERTTKAQDSKSPLDRVFVRCAHQIYPTLKQDGSVLGGATQRVTSSEIGYAGSPPREALTRGQSVDSIDRPFHPSEWIDVNLEVPSTPSSVITNLTANTNLYPTTTTLSSSTGSNLKTMTPIPPPRKRRKNRGRPLPPKPDEVKDQTEKKGAKNKENKIEPLYSSVKSQKIREAELQKAMDENKKNENDDKDDKKKEIHEHKVNGTGKIVAITNVREEDRRREDPGDRTENNSHEQNERMDVEKTETKNENAQKKKNNNNNNQEVVHDVEDGMNNQYESEYEKFSKSKDLRISSSTPNGAAKNSERESSSGKELREFVSRTIMDEDDDIVHENLHHRPKNYSTVSLPNYDELEEVKREVGREPEDSNAENSTPKKPGRARNISTISLPPTELLSSLPQGTTERLEKYMTRCRSFGSLQPQDILDKIQAQSEQIDSSDEDEWGGLDDWDLGVVEYDEAGDGRSPVVPSSRLVERKNTSPPKFVIGEVVDVDKTKLHRGGLKIDIPKGSDPSDENNESKIGSKEAFESDKTKLNIPRNSSFEMPKSPNSLKSALKLEPSRKISMPAKLYSDKPSSPLEDWFSAQERSVRFFDVPKLEEEYANTPGHRPIKPSTNTRNPEQEFDTKSYPFNGADTDPLNIDKFFEKTHDFRGIKDSGDSSIGQNRAKMLTRSLSNESEPFDGYEEKELTLEIRSQPSSIVQLSRTISDESIPAEMVVDAEEVVRKEDNKDSKTPPPSPEPKIHPEILNVDSGIRPNGVKMQKEEEGESNLSSMTPSLTELEAALSDMLEKEDQEEVKVDKHGVDDSEDSNLRHSETTNDDCSGDKPIEPKILSKQKLMERNLDGGEDKKNVHVRRRKDNNIAISLGQILNSSHGGQQGLQFETGKSSGQVKGAEVTPGKNPFEDTDDEEAEEEDVRVNESKKKSDTCEATNLRNTTSNPFDVSEPPEKPSRLYKVPLDHSPAESTPHIPTPPQRKNKHGAVSPANIKNEPSFDRETEFPIRDSAPHPNDRLI